MPKYNYVVKDSKGQTYNNVMDADSEKALISKLQAQNFFIISVKELVIKSSKKKKKKAGKRFARKNIKLDDMLIFARQLATMLQSGITLIRCLNVIQSQIQSQQLYEILDAVRKDVEQGSSLSLALSKYPDVFSQMWVSLLEVGEASGTIPTVLEKLTFYLEQQANFRSTIISGIIYPTILMFIATGAIAFFALVVGPKFQTIFDSMNAKLPAITVFILGCFDFFRVNLLKIFAIIGVSVFLFRKYIKTFKGRLRWEGFLFSMPQFGEIYRLIIVERFTSQLSMLVDAGVPILYGLDITERLVSNNTCALVISEIKESVKNGELIAEAMEKSDFFPPMTIQMITVGEETGELSKMLKHISAFYQDIVSTFMKRFATIIEPFMLIFMGATIGVIIVSMFMPMFNIAQMGSN